ncbi:hypothetical protein ACHQM5_031314 [Ranunculus cassubicifolius]
MDRTWTVVGVGGSPRVPSSGIPGEEDQITPRTPSASRGHGPTIEPCSIRSEKSNHSFLKPAFLRPKSRAERGVKLSVPGSPVAGFSGTARILRMGFQLSTL